MAKQCHRIAILDGLTSRVNALVSVFHGSIAVNDLASRQTAARPMPRLTHPLRGPPISQVSVSDLVDERFEQGVVRWRQDRRDNVPDGEFFEKQLDLHVQPERVA